MAMAVLLRSHDPLTHLNAFRSRPPPPTKPRRRKPTRPPPPTTKPLRRKPNRPPPPPPTTKPPRRKPRSLPKPAGRKVKENAVVVKAPSPSRKLVMEEVTILQRGGESNSSFPEARDDVLPFFSTNRIGPDPGILPKITELSVYAGPGFMASSPSPSSLPFPALFLKEEVHGDDEAVATKNLRFLLGIDVLP